MVERDRSFINVDETICLKCLTDKESNLKKDKVYVAKAFSRSESGMYTDYKLLDENNKPYLIQVQRDFVGGRFTLVAKDEKW